MKRVKSKEQRTRQHYEQKWFKQNLLILLVTAIIVSMMSIGYALLNTTLNIDGTARIIKTSQLRITNVEPNSSNCGISTQPVRWTTDYFSVDGNLPALNCTLSFTINVKNDTSDLIVIEDALEDYFNNSDMKYDFSVTFNTTNIKLNPNGGETQFTVTFGYNSELATLPSKTDFSAGFTLIYKIVQPPVITMSNSSRNFQLFRGSDFDLDARVSALDDIDGNITSQIVKTCFTAGNMPITCPNSWRELARGDYKFVYNVKNSFELSAIPLTVNINLWDIKKIDSGTYHSVVVASNGDLYTWGYNAGYRQGLGNETRLVAPIQHPTFANIDIVDAAACDNSGHAIDDNGNLWSWGTNGSYSLGDGTTTTRNTPVNIGHPAGEKYVRVECFFDTGVALTDAGNVYIWGWGAYGGNAFGQAGNKTVPTRITSLSNIVDIDMGYYNGAAIASNGTLYTWGTNGEGQLGIGNSGANASQGVTTYYNLPKNWQNTSNAQSICFGSYHAISTRKDGTSQSWGTNSYGRLGNGTAGTNSFSPYTFSGLNSSSCMANIYGGGVISSDGIAYLFGSNNYGEIGTGATSTQVVSPTAVNLSNITDGDMQLDSTHLIQDGITVYGFGYNGNGELGIGNITSTARLTAWETSNLSLMNVVEW